MDRANDRKASATAHFLAGRMQEALADYDAAAAACEDVLLAATASSAVGEAIGVVGVVLANQLQCLINAALPIGPHAFALVCDDVAQVLGGAYVLPPADDAAVARRRFKCRRWWIVGSDVPAECFVSMRRRGLPADPAADLEASSRSKRRQAAFQRLNVRTELKAAVFAKLFGRFAELLWMRYEVLRQTPPGPMEMAGKAHRAASHADEALGLLLDAQLCVLVCAKEFDMPCRAELAVTIRRELLRLGSGKAGTALLRAHPAVTLCGHPRFVSHGVGVVVTDAIATAGAELLVERPAVVATAAATDMATYEGRFAAAVTEFVALERQAHGDDAARQTLAALLGLHRPHTVAQSTVMDTLCDVWHHNAMRLTEVDFRINEADSDTFDGSAVYVTASRLNHSCTPKALCVFQPLTAEASAERAMLTVRLLTPLDEGDEVTIAYCPCVAARATKRSHCRFECQCQLCASGVLDTVICPATGEALLWPPLAAEESASETHVPSASITDGLAAIVGTLETTVTEIAAAAAASTPKAIVPKLRKLLTLFTSCPLLGELHYLRFRIGLESLAAAVVSTSITDQELSDALCQLAMFLDDYATQVLAPNWPLRTGLRMHLVFALGRHFAGMNPEDDEPCFLADPRIPALVAQSFQEHAVTTGSPSIPAFLERYGAELEAVGVVVPQHMDMLSRLVEAASANVE